MNTLVLVVVNFFDAHQTQRNAFRSAVSIDGWRHYPQVPNAYYKKFCSEKSDEELVRCCEHDMAHAANEVGVQPWDANCIIGEHGWLSGQFQHDGV